MSVTESRDLLLALAERALSANTDPAWLSAQRAAAMTRVKVQGLPTTRHEEWRFTPVSGLMAIPFGDVATPHVGREAIGPFLPPGVGGTLLVFVNGRFAATLSDAEAPGEGVVVTHLRDALARHEAALSHHLARSIPVDRQPFAALNTVAFDDGAVIWVRDRMVVEHPIHVLYFSTGASPFVVHPRTLIVAGESSRVRIVETYAGVGTDVYLTNAVTEIFGGENSDVEHFRVQRESLSAYHIASTQVTLERSARFAQQSFTFGSTLSRNDIGATLGAEGIECTLNGLYLGNGDRLADTHTVIDHAKPHCASHEIYKGMLDDRAKGVFNGKIFVRQDAQKTDAKQTNQVLLLSDDATINTKPQLEIFADDVKCTHGATVGQIDAEALFYLRARGIGEDEARSMLVHAFASDIIDRVTIEPLREQLEAVLLGYLPKG